MKIYLEIPDKWIDIESPTLWALGMLKDQVPKYIKEELVSQYLSKQPEYEITITPKELKEAILKELASRKANEIEDSHD